MADPLTERETEIRFLRRERRLLIDQDQARCRVLRAVINHEAVQAVDVHDVARIGEALLALHLEASGGVLRPNGSPCRCILCAPRRDLGKWPATPGADAADALAEKALGFCRHVMGEETCLIGRVVGHLGGGSTVPHCVACANCGVKIPWEDWTEEARAEWLNRLKEEN